MIGGVRLIGYWDGPDSADGWPDVCDFVSATVDPDEKRSVVAYLLSGAVYAAAAGNSRCRLCGSPNGSAEQSDGRHYAWPEGLAHYVEEHDVRLPDEVIAVAKHGAGAPVHPGGFDPEWWRSLARTTSGGGKPHRPGCRRHPAVANWNLPAEADIYLDRIPPASITVLAGVRRLLGLSWPLSGLRERLAAQPFRAVAAGDPSALRQALVSAPELRPYLFYRAGSELMPVWTKR